MTHQEFFFTILNILDKHKISYCLFAGTLLGAIRNKNFLPNDTYDTDVVLLDKDYYLVKMILDSYVEKNKLKWHYIWRKELSIRDITSKCKVDLFFMEELPEKYAVYSYKQNPTTKVWDDEWRVLFPKDIFFPTKTTLFLGRIVEVPNNSEAVLECSYGKTWKVPNPAWISNDTTMCNTDKNYQNIPAIIISNPNKPIAAVITTIKKDDFLRKCLSSFDRFNTVIYLLDQGKITPEKETLYKDLKAKGHHIFCIEKDIGLSAARNFLVQQVKEPYLMISDDDIELQSNPYILLDHFNRNENLGILGGLLIAKAKNVEQHYEYSLEIKHKTLYLRKADKIDLVLNFFIARTALFSDILWDEQLQMVEHTDFFLRLKQLNKWEVNYDRQLKGLHYSYELRPLSYQAFRSSKIKPCIKLFNKKWNIEKMDRQ